MLNNEKIKKGRCIRSGKIPYVSQAKARQAAIRLKGLFHKTYSSYFCGKAGCNGWHLTTQIKKKKNDKKR